MDFSSSQPIYLQIADEVRRKILVGELTPGDQLMSTTRYATTYRINPATANKSSLGGHAKDAVKAVLAQRPQAEGMPVTEWADGMNRWLTTSKESAFMSELERASLNYALKRVEEMADRLVATTRQAIADLGLPYALYLLGRLRQPGGVLDTLIPRVAAMEHLAPQHPLSFPDSLLNQLRGMGKAVLGGAGLGEVTGKLESELQQSAFHWLSARTAAHLATAMRDMMTSAVKPLEDVLDDARKVLVDARAVRASQQGIADVTTDVYSAWPQEPQPGQADGSIVPQRFATAHNEVVLMPVEQYPGRFEEHIADAVGGERDFHQAYFRTVQEVLSGTWEQGAGDKPPEDLLTVTTAWVPAGLPGAHRRPGLGRWRPPSGQPPPP